MLSSRSGFRVGHWGVDADANVFAAVTFWSDATAVASARAHLDALQEERRMHSVDPTATMNLRVLGSPKPWKAQDWATLQEHSGATWMRLVRYRPDPHARSDAPDYLRSTTEVVLRVLRHQPGFRMGYWGHDPEAGTMAAVTYWASGEAIASTGSLFARLSRERLAHGIRTEHIGNFRLFPGSGPDEQVTP